jgi:hypothetical protein
MPPRKTRPRPRVFYSPEIAAAICAGLEQGRKLRSICADHGMPDHATVFRWLAAHPEFRTRYDRAREGRGGTRYSPQLANAICEALVEGRSLLSICEEEGMPTPRNVHHWLKKHPEFREQYIDARRLQADMLFDETLDIADDARNDWMERNGGEDAGWVLNGENIQRSKLRIGQRKWMVARLNPKKYGDRVELVGDSESPVVTRIVREIVRPEKKGEGQ